MRVYRELLRLPGAAAFCSAALIMRAGAAMVAFGLIVMVRAVYGSYGLGGGLAAVYGLAVAATAAGLSNLVDRFGQRAVMAPLAVTSAVALGLLALAASLRAPPWTLFVASAVAGASSGAPGALVRARWAKVVPRPAAMLSALALESTLDEAALVFGPAAATLLATLVAPGAGLVAAACLILAGAAWFFSLRDSEPPPAAKESQPPAEVPRRRGLLERPTRFSAALRHLCGETPDAENVSRASRSGSPSGLVTRPGFAPLIAVSGAVGLTFGAINVSTVASAEAWGATSSAGLIAASITLGSVAGGLAYGAHVWKAGLVRRFILSCVVLGLMVCTLELAVTPLARALWGFAVGSTFAPMMVCANALAQRLAPPGRLTEALAWVSTSIGVGAALGAPVAGQLVDSGGHRWGMFAETAAALLVVAASVALAPSIRRSARGRE
jgi:MFS family permease